MSLDVPAPEPPELETTLDVSEYDDVEVGDAEYHREELQEYLLEGAWERAFEAWAADASLDEAAFDVVRDLDMIDEFDFFWDDFADRVGYHTPGIGENWNERELHPALDSWETVSAINAEMASLGQEVSELLKAEYVDWDSEYDAPDDLPDF